MRHFFLTVAAMLFGIFGLHAEGLVATLQHGEDMTPFYGDKSFVEAYEAATDGDIITLSSGQFPEIPAIEKSISIIGNYGFANEGMAVTTLDHLNIVADNVTIMGIRFINTLLILRMDGVVNGPIIKRCDIGAITNSHATNGLFEDCMIYSCYSDDTYFDNSVFKNTEIFDHFYLLGDSKSFINCVLYLSPASKTYPNGYFKDCLIGIQNDSDLKIEEVQFDNVVIFNMIENEDNPILKFPWDNPEKFVSVYYVKEDAWKSYAEQNFGSFQPFVWEGQTLSAGIKDHKAWPSVPRVIESNISETTYANGILKVNIKVQPEN